MRVSRAKCSGGDAGMLPTVSALARVLHLVFGCQFQRVGRLWGDFEEFALETKSINLE